MKEEKVKTQRCYFRKRRGVLCVDVVAECDRYVWERWERGVCKGRRGVCVRSPSLRFARAQGVTEDNFGFGRGRMGGFGVHGRLFGPGRGPVCDWGPREHRE